MIEWEQKMEVQILHEQGHSLRQIARQTGLCVNTVIKYLKHEGKPSYASRKEKVHKLMAYQDYIQHRLQGAQPLTIPATVVWREIKAQGYEGGLTQLRAYIRTLKPDKSEGKAIRFETRPGEQMQVDWIELQKLSAFVATLGFSCASYVKFVSNEKTQTLIECHEEAFAYFGGVVREVLYDNMKTVILQRDAYGPGRHRFHASLLDFAKHYHFRLRVCRPYRAQTKGKVERFNRYLRYSFYNPLVSQLKSVGLTLDVDTANVEVLKWLRDTANVRIHGTTKQRPIDCLAEERLQPMAQPYSGDVKRARPDTHYATTFCAQPLQRPLAVYQQLLEAL